MSEQVLLVAAVEDQELLQFWHGAMTVKGESNVASLENRKITPLLSLYTGSVCSVYHLWPTTLSFS